jgi:exonuclease SbcC
VAGQDDVDLIEHELSATSKQIHRCAQVIREVEQKEVQAKAARLELDKLNYALAESERVWEKGRNELKNAEQDLERLQQNCASLGNGCVQASDMALSRVIKYGIEELSIAELSSTLDGLTRRRDVWQTKQASKEILQKNINIEEIQLVKQRTLLGKIDEELQAQRLNLGRLINDLEGMEHARRDIFGDKCPDVEEKRLAEAVEYAEKQLEQARNEVGKADLACKNLQDRVAALTASIQGRTLDLTQAEQELHMRFIQAGFHDEAQYLGACLPEEERRRLSA